MYGAIDYYGSDDGRQLLVRHAWGLAIAAAVLCAVFGDGRIDLAIASWFFDDLRQTFPLANDWLLKVVLHDGARLVGAVAALTIIGLAVTSFSRLAPRSLRAQREALLLAASTCVAGAAAVGSLKHFSAHACPWDLALFGGSAAYQSLFGAAVAPQAIHGCSPAAHPLVGYAWLGIGFALAPIGRHAAWRAWAMALAVGTGLGVVQMLRGAHFMSHVFWSAWIVWAINIALLTSWSYAPRGLLALNRLWRPARARTES